MPTLRPWLLACAFAAASLAPAPAAQRASPRANPGGPPTLHAPGGTPGLGPGTVVARHKISSTVGGFPADTLDEMDNFGRSVAALGDLNGDGFGDLAVGSVDYAVNGGLFDGIAFHGAVWVLFLDGTGAIASYQKIDHESPGLGGELERSDYFGDALAALGDLDGDGVQDLAVQASAGGSSRTALWILFLNTDGTVKSSHRNADVVGFALASVGDLDGDGRAELALGDPGHAAVQILFLAADGSIGAIQSIGEASGGDFGSSLACAGDLDGDGAPELAVGAQTGPIRIVSLNPDGTVLLQRDVTSIGVQLGDSLAFLGDLDGNGVSDLAAGAPVDDDGGFDRGAVWVLFLAADASVVASQMISSLQGGFPGPLHDRDGFGTALAGPGDVDGDGLPDLAVGVPEDDDNSPGAGAVWVLRLNAPGTVKAQYKVSDRPGSAFEGKLDPEDHFGRAVAVLGDLDGNGALDVAVGAEGDDDGAASTGAVWILFLELDGTVDRAVKISALAGGFSGDIDGQDLFGICLAPLGDLDGDGTPDLAVGAPFDDDGGVDRGAVWVLFLRPDGTVRAHQKISFLAGGFPGPLGNRDSFGSALANLGDLSGDGTLELAVGANLDGVQDIGSVWVLSLAFDGHVVSRVELDNAHGVLTGVPIGRGFGAAVASLGDLDGDGTTDLVAGSLIQGPFSSDSGTLWILFLHPDGTVRAFQEIGPGVGGFTGTLTAQDLFGLALAALGDLDGDGTTELAVGAPRDGEATGGSAPNGRGAVWVLFLGPDGIVRSQQKLGRDSGGLDVDLTQGAGFGSGLALLGDRDGDGVGDLAVGSQGDWDGGNHGALWLLDLDGVARASFERADDVARTALVNGTALGSPPVFTRAFELTSSGANLGAAVFDSTPLGPNDPGPDLDLLVGKGNVLVLQNSLAPTQSVPGIFDQPDDDPDGGRLVFRFRAPCVPLSLDLIDIDLAGQQAEVVLVDAIGRRRTYAVPAGWTGDLLMNGPPAWRTLDLAELGPQPGFAAVAVASQSLGFDPRAVARIEVQLGGSGALDELRWDPHPDS